jgi:tetrahydromethanopterin S-methyltransferase subunit B
MTLVPIEGKDGFFRDNTTGAIVNRNKTDYENYINARNRLSSEKKRVDNLEQKVDNLQNDLSDIKTLLQVIANGK